MKLLHNTLVVAAIGAGLVIISAASASAAVVCSRSVCWHTREAYEYPAAARAVVHPDDWRWGPHERYSWREHEGRGYWRGGKWVVW